MAKQSKPALKKVLGQPSWRLANDAVEAYVTQTGGHVAPVKFKFGRRSFAPFSVAPWATEKLDKGTPQIIRVLRGDFFCMPFGGNATPFGKERHPVHGEPANANWTLNSGSASDLQLSLKTKIRRGQVQKHLRIKKGQRAIYSRHIISQMSGEMTFGHHAMIKFPDEPASGLISTSKFVYGQVFPFPVELPENRGYSILSPGAEFTSLKSVPMITGQNADLSRYPARRGFEDLVMLVSDPSADFAWTAVTFPAERFVWFALKDPKVLASTIFWISNGGRHYAPWNGRHVNVLGLEEVTSYFHPGLAESIAENPVSRKGHQTSVTLDPKRPLAVNYVMAAAEAPAGFDAVASIDPSKDRQSVTITSESGQRIVAPVDVDFLRGGGAL